MKAEFRKLMSEYEKIYSVEIEGKEYGFFLQLKEDGKKWLIIPDAGGQADMVPRHIEQLNWLEPKISELEGITQIWGTIWELETQHAFQTIEDLFLKEGKISNKNSWDFY